MVWVYFEGRDFDYFLCLGVLGTELNKVGEALRSSNLERRLILTRYRPSGRRHRLRADSLACSISVADSVLKAG